jgi:hypothetical protein
VGNTLISFSEFIEKYICFDCHTYGHEEKDGVQRCMMCGKIKEDCDKEK